MMKNRMKKLVGLSMATAMAVSVLGGCGNEMGTSESTSGNVSAETSATTESAVTQPTESEVAGKQKFDGVELKLVSTYEEGTATEALLEAINEILSEELGVTIVEVENFSEETYELMLGGDEDIDLVVAANWLRFYENAADGLFAEITDEDLQTYAPDIWALGQEEGSDILDISKVDGVRYAIGVEQAVSYPLWAYRGDLADKYGIGEINNPDDLEKYLFAIAENEPEMIAMDVPASQQYLVSGLFYPQIGWTAPGAASYGGAINVNFKDADYQVVFAPETPEYLELVTRMHEWYEKGVFSKSILSSSAGMNDSFKAGRSGVARVSNLDGAQALYDEMQADDRKDWDVRFMAHYPYASLLKGSNNSMMAISSYSEDVEASLAVLNEIYSNKELYRLFKYGLEGVDYEIVDGVLSMAEAGGQGNLEVYISNTNHDIPTKEYTFPNAAALIETMTNAARPWLLNGVAINYDAVSVQKIGVDETQAQYTRANLLGVFEGTPEEAVATEIAAYKAIGVDEYIAEIQRQIDEFVAGLE